MLCWNEVDSHSCYLLSCLRPLPVSCLSQVPSHLLEHFARDPRVVQSWARKEHEVKSESQAGEEEEGACRTPAGVPPSLQLIEDALVSRQEFAAIEVQTQLLYALVDQVGALFVCLPSSTLPLLHLDMIYEAHVFHTALCR